MVLFSFDAGFVSCAVEFTKLARANVTQQIVRNRMRLAGNPRLVGHGVFIRAFTAES
jgi:hypothetical protein